MCPIITPALAFPLDESTPAPRGSFSPGDIIVTSFMWHGAAFNCELQRQIVVVVVVDGVLGPRLRLELMIHREG